MENLKIELLTEKEMKNISGGRSGWYYVMYGFACFVNGVESGSQSGGGIFYK